MAPKRRKRRRPKLNPVVIEQILLRIPPDEPAHLFRASFVCKLWLRIASHPDFRRRYTAFHQRAPLLGFFYNLESKGSTAGFVSATSASYPTRGHSTWVTWVPDSRHGRVVLRGTGLKTFEVWDPFSQRWVVLQVPISKYTSLYNAAVLCAVPGCDHGCCRGGPFRVLFVTVDSSDYNTVHAYIYSSESRSWSSPASAQLDSKLGCIDMKRPAVIGDGIYCTVNHGSRILMYDLLEHRLSIIAMPHPYKTVPVLMQTEDGSLGIAGVKGSRLCLWSRRENDGVSGWVKQRVIKLKKILPVEFISDQANVIGFAEGAEVFFISTNAGAFTFELKSGRVKRVGEPRDYHGATPLISFVTPDCRCSKWTK